MSLGRGNEIISSKKYNCGIKPEINFIYEIQVFYNKYRAICEFIYLENTECLCENVLTYY